MIWASSDPFVRFSAARVGDALPLSADLCERLRWSDRRVRQRRGERWLGRAGCSGGGSTAGGGVGAGGTLAAGGTGSSGGIVLDPVAERDPFPTLEEYLDSYRLDAPYENEQPSQPTDYVSPLPLDLAGGTVSSSCVPGWEINRARISGPTPMALRSSRRRAPSCSTAIAARGASFGTTMAPAGTGSSASPWTSTPWPVSAEVTCSSALRSDCDRARRRDPWTIAR